MEVSDVGVVDALAELGFDGEDAALGLDDEFDFVAPTGGAKVMHVGLRTRQDSPPTCAPRDMSHSWPPVK